MKTFQMLNQGNPLIIDIYKEANYRWSQELNQIFYIELLADKLPILQLEFENNFARYNFNRWEGQEIFVISGLTYFDNYTNIGANYAGDVRKAFELSYCSLEVKGLAHRFASALYIGGY